MEQIIMFGILILFYCLVAFVEIERVRRYGTYKWKLKFRINSILPHGLIFGFYFPFDGTYELFLGIINIVMIKERENEKV